jgi:hypothetical protein
MLRRNHLHRLQCDVVERYKKIIEKKKKPVATHGHSTSINILRKVQHFIFGTDYIID